MKNLNDINLEKISNEVLEHMSEFDKFFPESKVTPIYSDIASYSSKAFALKLKKLSDSQIHDVVALMLLQFMNKSSQTDLDASIKKVRHLLVRTQKYINENYLEFNDCKNLRCEEQLKKHESFFKKLCRIFRFNKAN